MERLDSFLEKFKNLGAGQFLVREAFVVACKNILGCELSIKTIQFKNETILLGTLHPAIKTAIFVKKEKIIEAVKKATGKEIKAIR